MKMQSPAQKAPLQQESLTALESFRSLIIDDKNLTLKPCPLQTAEANRLSSVTLADVACSPRTDPIEEAGECSRNIPSQAGGNQPVEMEVDPARVRRP